ncbi:MAG: type II secretion system protein [Candidatus Omnitrophota bacterium]
MLNSLIKNKGVSLVEILISTVIFAIAAVGTFSTLSSMRRSSNLKDRSLQAAYYGRQLLEELRGKIDQDSWAAWYLTCDGASHNWPDIPAGNPFFDDFNGRATYVCTDVPPGLRKVDLTITWTE